MKKEYLGCGSSSCLIEKPKGQATNGGCGCLKSLPTQDRIRIEKCLYGLRDKIKRLEEITEETVKMPKGVEPHSLSDYKMEKGSW